MKSRLLTACWHDYGLTSDSSLFIMSCCLFQPAARPKTTNGWDNTYCFIIGWVAVQSKVQSRVQSTVQFYTVGVLRLTEWLILHLWWSSCLVHMQVCVCSLGSLAPPQAPQGQSASFHETFSAQEKSSCKQREWSIGHFDQWTNHNCWTGHENRRMPFLITLFTWSFQFWLLWVYSSS